MIVCLDRADRSIALNLLLSEASFPKILLLTHGNLNEDQWKEAAIILQTQLSDGTTHTDLVILQLLDDQVHPLMSLSLPFVDAIETIYMTEGDVVVRYSADSATETAPLKDRYHLLNGHLQQK